MKTKEKIILSSLEMFNLLGERNVTTNHIAAHLNMSPGNLYYHFRNKNEIIYEIFRNYEILVKSYLSVPESGVVEIKDLAIYLESVFKGLWAYRFLHRDLEHLMDSDERLRSDYRAFTVHCLSAIEGIISAMQESGLYRPLSDVQRRSKALNTWLIVTNWMTYLKTMHPIDEPEAEPGLLAREAIEHGIYQVLDYILPYIEDAHVESVTDLQQHYCYDALIPD